MMEWCRYYPKPEEETCVCGAGSDVSGGSLSCKVPEQCRWYYERRAQELEEVLKDTWMMIEHATEIDFSNGNVYAGVDEGDVLGWKYYHELRKKVEELGRKVEGSQ